MPPQQSEFAVIIPAKDASSTVLACLRAVLGAAAQVGGAPIVVVDNGSSDGTPSLIEREFGNRITVLERPGLTIGAVRNAGVAATHSETCGFIDADCVVADDWFLRVREVLGEQDAGAVGCYYSLPERPTLLERAWDRLHFPSADGPAGMINAGNLAIRRDVLVAVGGFSETLPTGEDAELCQRLVAQGVRVWQDRRIRARHLGNPRGVVAFFRKEYWHSLGAFGTVRPGTLDKPFLMTLAFIAGTVLAVVLLLSGHPWPALGATLAVPVVTVAYRGVVARRWPPLVLGVALYWVYFAARAAALPAAWGHRPSPLTTT